jgi:hypothetical protein
MPNTLSSLEFPRMTGSKPSIISNSVNSLRWLAILCVAPVSKSQPLANSELAMVAAKAWGPVAAVWLHLAGAAAPFPCFLGQSGAMCPCSLQ